MCGIRISRWLQHFAWILDSRLLVVMPAEIPSKRRVCGFTFSQTRTVLLPASHLGMHVWGVQARARFPISCVLQHFIGYLIHVCWRYCQPNFRRGGECVDQAFSNTGAVMLSVARWTSIVSGPFTGNCVRSLVGKRQRKIMCPIQHSCHFRGPGKGTQQHV